MSDEVQERFEHMDRKKHRIMLAHLQRCIERSSDPVEVKRLLTEKARVVAGGMVSAAYAKRIVREDLNRRRWAYERVWARKVKIPLIDRQGMVVFVSVPDKLQDGREFMAEHYNEMGIEVMWVCRMKEAATQ